MESGYPKITKPNQYGRKGQHNHQIHKVFQEDFPLGDAKIIKSETENDTASGYPVFAYREISADDAIFKISVEWRNPSREKRFYLTLRDGGNENKVEVIHREQKILINGKTAVEWPTDDTLVDQYRKIFRHYVPDKANRETSLRLYKLLFT